MSARRDWAPPPMDGYRPMIITVALTGAVPDPRQYPALPVTPAAIAEQALACAEAGASAFHLHMRDDEGRPTQARDRFEQTIAMIRAARTDLIINVTTSSRVNPDMAERTLPLQLEGELRPDMASLTLGSFNFRTVVSNNPPEQIVALAEAMADRGIRPELEIFELGMINTLHDLRARGLLTDPVVSNILLGSVGSAPAFVGDLEHMVRSLPSGAEWAAAGIGRFQRPMVIAAAIMDGNVRVGMEDDPRGDGSGTWSNVDAVKLAVQAAELAGRQIATPTEARTRFGLEAR